MTRDRSPLHDALRDQIDQLTAVFEAQQARMEQLQQQLAQQRTRATSADGLVEVTVDAEGTVTHTRVTAKTMRSTPEKVEAAFTEAARAASAAAREQREALIAPLAAEVDSAPDLSDLVPGVSSFKELRETLLGGNAPRTEPERHDPSDHPHR